MLRQRIIASTIKFSELQERLRRRGSAVLMDDEELKKQFFKDHSRRVATENIYSEVADLSKSLPPARSFSDLKKNNERRSEIFQEISNRKRTESQKRKKKRELNKSQKDLSDEQ